MVTALIWSVVWLARAIVLTAAYLALAWALMVSYQIFTETAIEGIAASLAGSAPSLASGVSANGNLVVFLCSFAWMFVLSSVIQSLTFGKERRLTVQFLVSLALTVAGSALLELLKGVSLDLSNPNVLSQPFNALFGNGVFAFFYLSLPFLFMVAIDLRAILRKKK